MRLVGRMKATDCVKPCAFLVRSAPGRHFPGVARVALSLPQRPNELRNSPGGQLYSAMLEDLGAGLAHQILGGPMYFSITKLHRERSSPAVSTGTDWREEYDLAQLRIWQLRPRTMPSGIQLSPDLERLFNRPHGSRARFESRARRASCRYRTSCRGSGLVCLL
jgi:hypothetical protein